MISGIIDFFKTGIWEVRLKDLSPLKAFVVRYLRVIILALHEFRKDECSLRASALTYYSLLNVVPVAAMAFAIAKGFGLEKLFENQIIQFVKRSNWQEEVASQIIAFSHSVLENAKGGLIAGIGVILLFWTVISILGEIEKEFNQIWEVTKSRTLLKKINDYIAIIILAPILFIISSSMTIVVASRAKVIVNSISLLGAFSPVIFFLLGLLPYLFIWILLILLYHVMPNTRVPLKSGLLASIVAGTVFQVVQWIYIKFQIGVSSYGAIYGSFAALPLFLVWLQLSWMIILFGAEFAFADENFDTFGFHPDYSRISISSKKVFILRIFQLLVERFLRGEKPLSAFQIAQTLQIPARLVRQLLDKLISIGLVVEVAKGTGEVTYQPGRSVDDITVKYILDAYEQSGSGPIPIVQSEEAEKISMVMKKLSDVIEKAPENLRLKDF